MGALGRGLGVSEAMSFEERGESVIASHALEDLKLVYRVLHEHLTQHPALMDTHFLIELQNFLHAKARQQGVDTADHGAWDTWLGHADAAPCDRRVARRRVLDPNQGRRGNQDRRSEED